jgi:succinyl-CoA synthetase beta subunit
MRLFEVKAKEILKKDGLNIPRSYLLENVSDVTKAIDKIGLPFVMKVQTLTGGRGKEGGIYTANSKEEAIDWYETKIGTFIKGYRVESILCEEYIPFNTEYYISFSLDTNQKEIVFLFSNAGGIDVEENKEEESLFTYNITMNNGPEVFKLIEILSRAKVPVERWQSIIKTTNWIYDLFLEYDCMLLEINPLVWTKNDELCILDVHLYMDDNAILFHEDVKQVVMSMPDIYQQSWLKTKYGFDMVVLNPDGEVGMLSTGAGLSMATVDEMTRMDIHPINFADIRSGQIKGDPTRLVVMLEQFKKFDNLKYIFVSIFAGITDLAEFAESLLQAKDQVEFKNNVEWIIRLEGNNYENAKELLEYRNLYVSNSLEDSIKRCLGGENIERVN